MKASGTCSNRGEFSGENLSKIFQIACEGVFLFLKLKLTTCRRDWKPGLLRFVVGLETCGRKRPNVSRKLKLKGNILSRW